ncbi:MAG: alkyl hydroperoxide reductase/Thiol specific antioxidant/Mal allergen [Gemmatimonadetes bacterium]|nr:alkyl hydroperoxide reductase/Thiol specific antioxidant/Mal allergen [Gemmatimonadota bacterium]
MDREDLYRVVFRAAAVCNVAWGAVAVLFPTLPFDVFGLSRPNYPFLMSGIGMMVAVYGYGYWVVAGDPRAHPELVVVGLLGKALGPIGWAWNVWLGAIPARTLWIIAFNDLIWVPFFVSFLVWQRRTRFEELLARVGTG